MFQVHGVDAAGAVTLRRAVRRRQVLAFFAKLPPCLVGMEACATAHCWGRNKNDPADAAATCEAVNRPSMRFVTIKTEVQQAAASLHGPRQSDLSAPDHHPRLRADPVRCDGRVRGRPCRLRQRTALLRLARPRAAAGRCASGTLLTLGTHAPPRHARERGYPGRPTPCLGPWTPAFAGVTEDEATGVICLVRTTS